MDPLIECVPNFSEGRRPLVIKSIVEAIHSTAGVKLLDFSHDANHNRMVVTFVGGPEAVEKAALAGARTAVELIDLNRHTGEHPRIGAVDVIPLVPLSGITLEACAARARQLGEKIYEALKLPVYFYEAAARTPSRKNLADVRKGNFEGLKTEIQNPDRYPDVGEPKLHPTAGAVAVGARPFLVAFNVNLDSNDLAIAKAIANKVREARGGLKNVKALGLKLEDRGMVQVSMNLTNCDETPIHQVIDAVRGEAAHHGVQIAGTEIVGLVPLKYLAETAAHSLSLDGFKIEQILETHL